MLARAMGIHVAIRALTLPNENFELRDYLTDLFSEFEPTLKYLKRPDDPYVPHQRFRLGQFIDLARIYDTTQDLGMCPVHSDYFKRSTIDRYYEQGLISIEDLSLITTHNLRIYGYMYENNRRPSYACKLTSTGEHRLASLWTTCFPSTS